MIGGEMMSHLDEEHKHDLCVLAPPIERDRLTKLLEGRLAWIFRKRTAEGSTYYVPEQRVKIFVTLFSIVAAAAFLTGAIVALYLVQQSTKQLLMLGGFTIGFAGALGLLTNARRQDVFAATAAYAAVLVVFISGSLSGTPSSGNNVAQGSAGVSTTIIATTSTLTSATATTFTQFSFIQSTSTISLVTTISTTSTAFPGPTQTSSVASSSSGLSAGAISGIVIGVYFGLISIAISWFTIRRRASVKSKLRSSEPPPWSSPPEELTGPTPKPPVYPMSEMPSRGYSIQRPV